MRRIEGRLARFRPSHELSDESEKRKDAREEITRKYEKDITDWITELPHAYYILNDAYRKFKKSATLATETAYVNADIEYKAAKRAIARLNFLHNHRVWMVELYRKAREKGLTLPYNKYFDPPNVCCTSTPPWDRDKDSFMCKASGVCPKEEVISTWLGLVQSIKVRQDPLLWRWIPEEERYATVKVVDQAKMKKLKSALVISEQAMVYNDEVYLSESFARTQLREDLGKAESTIDALAKLFGIRAGPTRRITRFCSWRRTDYNDPRLKYMWDWE